MIGRSDGKFPRLSGFRALPLQVRGGEIGYPLEFPPSPWVPFWCIFGVSRACSKKESEKDSPGDPEIDPKSNQEGKKWLQGVSRRRLGKDVGKSAGMDAPGTSETSVFL